MYQSVISTIQTINSFTNRSPNLHHFRCNITYALPPPVSVNPIISKIIRNPFIRKHIHFTPR